MAGSTLAFSVGERSASSSSVTASTSTPMGRCTAIGWKRPRNGESGAPLPRAANASPATLAPTALAIKKGLAAREIGGSVMRATLAEGARSPRDFLGR